MTKHSPRLLGKLKRVKIWQWAILIVLAVIAFAALRPEPFVFDALAGGRNVSDDRGCRIVTNSEKVCAGTYQFEGDPQAVVSQLRLQASPDTVRIIARKGNQFERLKGSADVIEVYPNTEVIGHSPSHRLKGAPGRFVVRYRVTRPLSFLEQLPLKLFKVVI